MNIRYPIYEGVYRILTHVLPFSFHILEYFSKHTKDRKAAWNLNSHRTDNR